ncbi:MAG: hypothetical protein ACRC2T_06615 [Thermoguttaceae bacterium]
MQALPTKFYEATELMRMGKIEQGLKTLDRVDGFDNYKAVPLAELAYFRGDWKNGLEFAKVFLSDGIMLDDEYHLHLFLRATCQMNAWKSSRDFLSKLIKKEYPVSQTYYVDRIKEIIALLADQENTRRMLTEKKPEIRIVNDEKYDLEISKKMLDIRKNKRSPWDLKRRKVLEIMGSIRKHISSELHAELYEEYEDIMLEANDHVEAAKTYIALGNIKKAKKAIKNFMTAWKFYIPIRVAPIVLFVDSELLAVMADAKFTNSLLSIPHNR